MIAMLMVIVAGAANNPFPLVLVNSSSSVASFSMFLLSSISDSAQYYILLPALSSLYDITCTTMPPSSQ